MNADRLPPHDLDAEQATLGSMLIDPQAALRVAQVLTPEDFYSQAHQLIYRAAQSIAARGEPVDIITVRTELNSHLEQAGGAEYLLALPQHVATTAHCLRYAHIVREKAQARRAIVTLAECVEGLYAETVQPSQLLEKVMPLQERGDDSTADVHELTGPYHDWLTEFLTADPEPELPILGIPVLDRKLGGLGREELVVVKAEEKMGKTTLLTQSLLATARKLRERGQGERVLLYHLEGSMTSWLTKAVSHLGHVDSALLKHGALHGNDTVAADAWSRITKALAELDGLPIRFAQHLYTLAEVTADALYQQAESQGRVKAIYVDYLQKLQAPGATKTEAIMAASQGLIQLGKRVGCPIITASQLTRDDAGNTHAFYARGIEQDASLVLYLERGPEGCKNADEARTSSQARLRNTHARLHESVSPTELHFEGAYAAFYAAEVQRSYD